MKRLIDIGFLILCESDEIIWQLQHGTEAKLQEAVAVRKRLYRELSSFIPRLTVVFE
jgi:hypothetical protein